MKTKEEEREYKREYQRQWRAKNPERRRELERKQRERDKVKIGHRKAIFDKWLLKSKYGLTLESYETLLKEQNGCCAICFKPNNLKKRLAVDHNHETGKNRGLLCDKCNMGIGNLGDDPSILLKAYHYLLKYDDNKHGEIR